MKCNGQIHFEALICTAMLFVLIAMAISTVNSLKIAGEKANEMLIAEAKAQKCSFLVDALFSNSGGILSIKENCYAGNVHEVKCSFNGRDKTAFSVAPRIISNQAGNTTVLEVAVDAHYS